MRDMIKWEISSKNGNIRQKFNGKKSLLKINLKLISRSTKQKTYFPLQFRSYQ